MTIDLRSDTVTRPTTAMRAAMAQAEVGDDVFGDDPTVNRLQEHAAGASSAWRRGSSSRRARSRTSRRSWRTASAARKSSSARKPTPIATRAAARRCWARSSRSRSRTSPTARSTSPTVEAAIKPDDSHFAITKLIALENTIGGKVLARAYMADAIALARRRGLSIHLDGARIFNAAVKLGMPVKELCAGFDTVSVCLSKGLGTPGGNGAGGQGRRDRARAAALRKMLGGTMRQVGHPRRRGPLRARAQRRAPRRRPRQRRSASARGSRALGLKVDPVQTNMVFATFPKESCAPLQAAPAVAGHHRVHRSAVAVRDAPRRGCRRHRRRAGGFRAVLPREARASRPSRLQDSEKISSAIGSSAVIAVSLRRAGRRCALRNRGSSARRGWNPRLLRRLVVFFGILMGTIMGATPAPRSLVSGMRSAEESHPAGAARLEGGFALTGRRGREQNRAHWPRLVLAQKIPRRKTMKKPDFDRSRRRVLKAMAGGAAAAGTLGFPAIVRAQQDAMKFGHITPRTGFLGQVGDYGYKAASMAVDEANAAGGVLGRKIELIAEDSVNPATAVTKAQQAGRARPGDLSDRRDQFGLGARHRRAGARYKIPFFNTGCQFRCAARRQLQPLHVPHRRQQHHVHQDHRHMAEGRRT